MSFLFLTNSLKLSGSEKKFAGIASALADRGHDIHLLCLNSPTDLALTLSPRVSWQCLERVGPFDFRAGADLTNYVRSHSIQKVLAVNLYPSLYANQVQQQTGVPYSVAINQLELLSKKDRLQMPLYRFVLRRASHLVFGAEIQERLWTDDYGLNDVPRRLIYNGTPTRKTSKKAPDKTLTIGTIANFRPWKGIETLVDGFAAWSFRDKRLVILGDGASSETLKERLVDRGIQGKTELLPVTSDVGSVLERFDVFCLPARSELFSNSALEAMAYGIPLVLSKVGGLPEMITHGEEGLLVPPDAPNALADALSQLEDEERRSNMGKQAQESCRRRFPYEGMVDAYEKLLKDNW